MNAEEFESVIARIKELWGGHAFLRKWNEANQRITFKMLSTFAQHEVLDCIENHRYDNPDEREPKFKVLSAKLWAVKKARAAQDGERLETSLPSWLVVKEWADCKSEEDLDHLWSNADRLYSEVANVSDKLWPFLNSLERRSNAALTVAWAVERGVELTFQRGTDEWHAVMDEYDRSERRKSVEAAKGNVPIKPLEPYPQEKTGAFP